MYRATDSAGFGRRRRHRRDTVGRPARNRRALGRPDDVGEDEAARIREIHETDERLNDPAPIAQVDAADYDAVVSPGGHGAEWDVNQDVHARALLTRRGRGGGWHGAGRLPRRRHPGVHQGLRRRTARRGPRRHRLPERAGRRASSTRTTACRTAGKPYWVEDEVVAAGGNWDAELDADSSVTVDGDLITARGPESSTEAAQTLIDELGVPAE